MKTLLLLLTLAVVGLAATAQPSFPTPFGPTELPEGFLANRGQVRDFHNKPVEYVYFQANLGGQQVFITRYGLSILLSRTKSVTRQASAQSRSIKAPQNASPADSLTIARYELERIDIVLKGASISPGNISTTARPGSPQYHLYLDNRSTASSGLQLQSEVLIKNVYPGIDWKVYIQEGKGGPSTLKYDFIVHPGADPSRIRLRYSDNAPLVPSGSQLKAQARMGVIREEEPYSYLKESGAQVEVAYRVKKNSVQFQVAPYDTSSTLVIDPSIFWMTYLSANDPAVRYQSIFGNDVETDRHGNIFVQLTAGGNTPFPTKNPGGGAYFQDHTASPNGSMILLKFAPGGQLLWATYFGSSVGGRHMTIDKEGNIIALGAVQFTTPDYTPANPTIPLLDNGGFYNAKLNKYFITRFSGEGVLEWSTYYLSEGSYPMDMSYDESGNVYVVGWSTIWDFPTADPGGGAYVVKTPQAGHAQTLFISQFDPSSRLTWSTRIEGNDYDPYARVCTDRQGNIYLGGQTRSTNYPLVNAGGYFNDNSYGSVITRFNAARQMTWSTYYPGAFALADLTTDTDNNLYVMLDRRIVKFNSRTERVFETSVTTTQMHFWSKIQYDPVRDQLQLLGVMNDGYWGFPTINTACNGSFFHNGQYPRKFTNATGPIFATLTRDGVFTYRSLVDWIYEYYNYNEMTVDIQGNPIYLFGNNYNAFTQGNPQLTNPGNGAYFDPKCCYSPGMGRMSALLLKLIASEISVDTVVTAPSGCDCSGTITARPACGQAPFRYEWSNGAATETVTGLCPGTYWVKVTDATGLSKTLYVTLPNPPGSVSSFLTDITQENCHQANGSLTVHAVQGGMAPYAYALNEGAFGSSASFTGLDSGRYVLSVKDASGCVIRDTVTVSRIQGPSAVRYEATKSTCLADDGQLRITGVQGGVAPYRYALGDGAENTTGHFTGLAAAAYPLRVTDAAGCTYTTTLTIERSAPPTEVRFTTGNDHCGQGIGFVEVTGVTGGTAPYTFSVDNQTFGSSPLISLAAGPYTLLVKDANGCVLQKDGVTVGAESGPTAVDLTVVHAVCGKATGELTVAAVKDGVQPFSYAVDGAGFGPSDQFTGIAPGSHTLVVKDRYGCTLEKSFEVTHTPMAAFHLVPADTTVCYGEQLSLTLLGDADEIGSLRWNIPAQGTSALLRAGEEKSVWVTITDKNNCVIRDTALVRVKACNPPETCLEIPTAFSPNKDGKNETVGPLANGCIIASVYLQIFNRWGEPVYETRQLGTGWDGRYKGREQPVGVYPFLCTYVGEDGVKRERKGTILLLR